MLTEYEVQKLKRGIRQDWNATSGVVPTCAALLLTIMVLSLIGSRNEPQRDVGGGTVAEQKSASLQLRRHMPAAERGTNPESRNGRPQAQSLSQAKGVSRPTDEPVKLPAR